jgi:DNA-directed RNA polymerase subunit M/transcription elongation factor TFIIS
MMGKSIRGIRGGGDDGMWKFRSCPKCGGDLYVDYDLNGWYEQCLQCGYMHDLKSILEIKKETSENKNELVLAGRNRRKVL